jgi:hypothetical protein
MRNCTEHARQAEDRGRAQGQETMREEGTA